MKKVSSVVWQFFDRLEENKRCVAVLCKLCDTEYKYFGNTTNLRGHLIKKHPIQWELRQTNWDGQKTLEDATIHATFDDDESTNHSTVSPKRRKYSRPRDKNVDVLETSETEDHDREDNEATLNLVRQMHDTHGSDEEWLEDEYNNPAEMYEPKRKKAIYRKIKREVVTPPRRSSNYYALTSAKAEKQHLIINDSRKDEYSVFGEYIANKLRKFKAPRTRGNIQQLITTILWQAEYGLYDDADAVKRVLMSSVQDIEPEQTIVMQSHDTVTAMPTEQFGNDKKHDNNEGVESDNVL
ncbi:uncharacterized protein LOC113239488 isoform X2 [Hyposmocoma kahamanoa]|uniref:uncharacterized protein LOC113239488 isoform X2 n=1 Tax=Hyposmocoma kahamanoa TaxID=1477025 RepID=UPI000E6D8467|nr:uncharacterized protein LOC113239488 isoform X2 [Hyposmocoma kahamanoa]